MALEKKYYDGKSEVQNILDVIDRIRENPIGAPGRGEAIDFELRRLQKARSMQAMRLYLADLLFELRQPLEKRKEQLGHWIMLRHYIDDYFGN